MSQTDTIERKVNHNILLGEWKNPKFDTKGILGFTFLSNDGELVLSIEGATDGLLPGNWGKAKTICHATSPENNEVVAFQAEYELSGKSVFLAGNINQGLIIIACYVQQSDNLEESNFFIREFFYKLK